MIIIITYQCRKCKRTFDRIQNIKSYGNIEHIVYHNCKDGKCAVADLIASDLEDTENRIYNLD